MSIRLLPPEVASQIAAGEVVERPASVIKELIENSLDAGATSIGVQVEGAGQRLIEVSDDGRGIPSQELALALERHATSKLNQASDLFEIRTLGFRGEALASIGSVSRLTLTSRLQGTEVGARLRVEGGLVGALEPAGAPVGTVVRVEDLFFNVPARLKFLKQDSTERRVIDTLVTRYALAYPHVRFQLRQDGRPALQTSGNGNRREVLANLYGVEIARQMLEVVSEQDEMTVQGFISPTSLTRSNRREMTFFVNGRPVQDSALAAALLRAYHTLLMVGRFPLAILFIDLPPSEVDVNVHPAKAEVRFRSPDRIFSGLQNAVRKALLAHTPIPGLEPEQIRWTGLSEEFEPPAPSPGLRWETAPTSPTYSSAPAAPQDVFEDPAQEQNTAGSVAAPPPAGPTQAGLPETNVPLLRLVGQVAGTFLVAEGPDGLYLVDQHAAHERVLFERFLTQASGEVPSQSLLQPVTVDLPAAAARLLTDQLPILERLGFRVEPFGLNTFLVRAVPLLLAKSDPRAALQVVVEDFEEDETPLQAEVEARLIARVCKRAAVKGGQTLSVEEQRALLRDLESCRSPRTCPHGRPTMIHLPVDMLERQFGRKGAR